LKEPLLTISEASKDFGVDEWTLRYWDRVGILVPHRVGALRVYDAEDQEKLGYVKSLTSEGFRPSEIKNFLMATSFIDDRSISQTKALHEILANSKRGDEIQEPFGLNKYNTVYQRVTRTAKKHGKRIKVTTSEDGKSLRAKVL
jgi:DNA-binding transcriptional MerR regulator